MSKKSRNYEEKSGIESILNVIIHACVYLMTITPIIVNTFLFFPYVGPKGLFLMTLIEIAFFSWLVLAYLKPQYRIKRSPIFYAVTAYIVILILATLFGADPMRSFWSKFERMSGLLMWLHLYALFLVTSSVFKKEHWHRFFLASLAIACIVCIAFFANIQGTWTAADGSTLGNSSFLATYILFNLFFAIYLIYFLFKKLKQGNYINTIKFVFALVVFVLMLVTLYASKAQAAKLSFAGGVGFICLFLFARKYKKIGKVLVIAAIAIYILGSVLLLVPDSFVQDMYLQVKSKARPLIWQQAWEGFSQRPILGWGPQNFGFVFNKTFNPCFYADECGGQPRFDQAHNIIMDNLIDTGVLGLIAYLAMFGSVFWILWKKKVQFFAAAVFSSLLLAHFAQNLTVFDMPASYLMLFFVFGYAGSCVIRKPVQREFKEKKISIVAIIATALLGLCLFFFVYKPIMTSWGIIKVLAARDSEQLEDGYDKALNSSPMGRYQIRNHLTVHLLGKAQSGQVNKEEFDLLEPKMLNSVQDSPLDFFSHLNIGKFYNAYGAFYDQSKLYDAERFLDRAVELAPTKQEVYWEVSKTKVMLGKTQEGVELAERAVALYPKLDYSHLHLINLLKVVGLEELVEIKVYEAIKAIPGLESKVLPFLE